MPEVIPSLIGIISVILALLFVIISVWLIANAFQYIRGRYHYSRHVKRCARKAEFRRQEEVGRGEIFPTSLFALRNHENCIAYLGKYPVIANTRGVIIS